LISASASSSDTRIEGKLSAQLPPGRGIAVFFYGEQVEIGRTAGPAIPIGGIIVNTDSSGRADFIARVPVPLPAYTLTAIATDIRTNDTSEVSNPVEITGTAKPDLKVEKSGPETARCGESIIYTITVTNVGTAAAIGASVIDTLPVCVGDEVTVTTSQEGLYSYPAVGNKAATLLPRLNPGDSVTIIVMARLTENCGQFIINVARGEAAGDTNIPNDQDDVRTKVDCTKITAITTSGKHVTVNGIGFQKGDRIEINGAFASKTKFIDVDELFAKKGKKLLLPCDPANPGRTNLIRLIRSRDPGAPVLDTQAFATCP
jgi:uncharacterized repeat protein (TIGR01451 family)